ncbi:hypothetical protein PVK06_036336 [Gossypium arboreum]|uniref:Uncharacterized protein n=1 Tax=Gossypium arboreum TaxID=29729 RepID=A0ABR0NLG9_GOSAR|nr:hypothetical protein PVK06_036336 [Gossypium arboreum]
MEERDMKELWRSKGKEILNTDQSRKILGSQNNGQADFNKRGSNALQDVLEQTNVGEILQDEREPLAHQTTSNLKEDARREVVDNVGNLDSSRHSAVDFFENKESPLKTNPLAPMGTPVSRKETKFRGKSIKQNKRFHGSNVKFKNVGSYRVSLNKSMKHLSESISSI